MIFLSQTLSQIWLIGVNNVSGSQLTSAQTQKPVENSLIEIWALGWAWVGQCECKTRSRIIIFEPQLLSVNNISWYFVWTVGPELRDLFHCNVGTLRSARIRDRVLSGNSICCLIVAYIFTSPASAELHHCWMLLRITSWKWSSLELSRRDKVKLGTCATVETS